ncbi:MAG: HD domain-containing phosphohydrolase [Sedimenticola sp.]
MNNDLRILIIDDSERDAVLLEHILKQSWPGIYSRRVETLEEMQAALDESEWDLLLSDEVMPHFDAKGALSVLHQNNKDIPFIVCSGVMILEEAVELLRGGAADFVRKDDLARLEPAVERELEQAENRRSRHQAELALKRSESFNRGIIDSSRDCIMILDLEGRLEYMSPAGQELLEIDSIGEYLQSPWVDLWQGQYRSLAERALAASLENNVGNFQGHTLTPAGTDKWWDVIITPILDSHGHPEKLLAVSRDITQSKLIEKERQRQDKRLLDALLQTIAVIGRTIERRDPYTAGHQQRVTVIALAIAEKIGLPEEKMLGLKLGSLIHDIGKIAVPAEILVRPGKLTESEFSIIQEHCQTGYEIIQSVNFPWPVADQIHHHHERLDGSGYPQGLKGDEIGIEARILAVADIVEAMSSHRPYRPAVGVDEARKVILSQRGTKLDPQVVDACVTIIDEGLELPTLDESISFLNTHPEK